MCSQNRQIVLSTILASNHHLKYIHTKPQVNTLKRNYLQEVSLSDSSE